MTVRLLTGDCREVMATLDADSVDAIVTDPPYGLGFMGREWDSFTPAVVARTRQGLERKTTTPTDKQWARKRGKKSQVGGVSIKYDESIAGHRRYQDWCEGWAVEALRVLKPGGHMLVSGGTRTFHRLTCALEDAGFEIRDCLAWLFGSGFPKSHNLSGEWRGWGTALKPGYEPIILARKPLIGTVAANVERHGTGAINVDGCRIESEGDHKRPYQPTNNGRSVYGVQTGFQPTNAEGRWPANVVLAHSPGCREVGVKRVKPGNGSGLASRGNGDTSMFGIGSVQNAPGYVDADGFETVAAWECEPDCAVAMLDAQSGASTSKRADRGKGIDGATFRNPNGAESGVRGHNDTGGASRFFYCAKASRAERNAGLECSCYNQAVWESTDLQASIHPVTGTRPARDTIASTPAGDSAWRTLSFGSESADPSLTDSKSTISTSTSKTTVSKTSRSSRQLSTSDCTQDANAETVNGGSHAASVENSSPLPLTTGTSAPKGGPSTGDADPAISASSSEKNRSDGRCPNCGQITRSIHPTVKPLALMRWLVRLITPPGGLVLDPFMGSGTTGIACSREGFNFIGIEQDAEYCEIARRRIAHAMGPLFAAVEVAG